MKKIEAIICPAKMEALKDALSAANVKGMTISQVKGFGNQHGWTEYFRGSEILVNLVPKVKFEIVAADEHVDAIVELILETARSGKVGDGKIFVQPIDEVIRIRTGEHGSDAI